MTRGKTVMPRNVASPLPDSHRHALRRIRYTSICGVLALASGVAGIIYALGPTSLLPPSRLTLVLHGCKEDTVAPELLVQAVLLANVDSRRTGWMETPHATSSTLMDVRPLPEPGPSDSLGELVKDLEAENSWLHQCKRITVRGNMEITSVSLLV